MAQTETQVGSPDAGPRGPRRHGPRVGWQRRSVPTILLGAVLGFLVIMPMGMLIRSSFTPTGLPGRGGWTLEHYQTIYSDPGTYGLIGNTLFFAVGSTIVALTIGLVLAWLVERTDLPYRNLVRVIIILPMAMPQVLLGISWVLLMSPDIGMINHLLMTYLPFDSAPFNIYSMVGMFVIQGISLVPTTFLVIGPAVRNMDPSFEEAAFTSGASTRMLLRRIVLPLISPSVLAVATFLLILGVVVFDIPGTLGQPAGIQVLSTTVVRALRPVSGLPEYGEVSALAMAFLVFLVVLASLYYRFIRRGSRFTTISGKGYRTKPFALGKWRRPALALVAIYFVVVVLGPFLVLLWTSLVPFYTPIRLSMIPNLSLDNHARMLSSNGTIEAALNSLTVVVVASTCVAILAAITSWVVVRSKAPGRKVLDAAAFSPLAMPGVMIGVALVYMYIYLPIPVYGTIWIIALAYIANYLAYGTRVLNGVMLQIHSDLEEAAYASGASWRLTFRRVIAPLVSPAVLAVWFWVAAQSLRELSAALVLQGRGNHTLPVRLWGYWQSGQLPMAATIGVWMIAGLAILLGGWFTLMFRRQTPTGEAVETG